MLDRSEVMHIARLARLDLDDAEVDRMGVELSTILDHVESLSELDLSGVEPTAHPVAQSGGLREDEPRDSLSRETILAAAPETDGIGFIVPSPNS